MARRTIQEAGANLRAVATAGLIGPRYIQGVNGADWQTPAASDQAEQNYATGVQAAVAEGRRRAGILAVTNAEWRTAAAEKGGAIIGNRIVGAIEKYQRNFGPILTAMNAAAGTLPARTTSASQNIQNRMLPVVRAAVEAAGKTFS